MKEKLHLLFQKYLKGTALNEEKAELAQLAAKQSDETLTDLLKSAWNETSHAEAVLTEEQASSILQNILKPGFQETPVYKIPFYKRTSFRVAASIILLVAVFAILKITSQKSTVIPLEQPSVVVLDDIEPGTNKAILQLADGSKIILDSSNNGNIASQGQTKIIKIDGQLAYSAAGSSAEVLYNTISTPRGGQYQIELVDGTKVWLNAASSLRFTTNFIGDKRMVELTGEAYFEVAKNAAMPFVVKVAGREEVEVLGTHFNINSYTDEPIINTTLLEGKVKVTALNVSNASLILNPGNQAQLFTTGKLKENKNIDIEKVMAWRNNVFNFNNENIETIMRQLSRWYDVDVKFEGQIPKVKFSGEIGRNLTLKQVLSILEDTRIAYRLEDRTLIIGS